MTRTSVRGQVRAALTARLAAKTELAGVKIMNGVNPKEYETETVAVTKVTGSDAGIRDMRAGRKARRDNFEIEVSFWTGKQGQTALEAMDRAEALFAPLEDVLADDPFLGVQGLMHAQLSNWDGPDCYPAGEGFGAEIVARVACATELY